LAQHIEPLFFVKERYALEGAAGNVFIFEEVTYSYFQPMNFLHNIPEQSRIADQLGMAAGK
jgi:hypothetical protein